MKPRSILASACVFAVAHASLAQCPTTVRITASDPHALDTFGDALSACGDSTTGEPRLAVGAPYWTAPGLNNSGKVYTFGRVGGVWGQLSTVLPPANEANQHFGAAVAMIDPYLLVGAPNAGTVDSGHASIYERSGSTWVYKTSFLPAGIVTPNAHAGAAVALTTFQAAYAAVGSPDNDGLNSVDAGSVHFYKRTGGVWSYVNGILGSDFDGDANDNFGTSVALAPDSEWGAIGAPGRTEPGQHTDHGTVMLVKRDANGLYGYSSILVPDGASSYTHFGQSVAMSGNLLAVGAPNFAFNGHPNLGTVYIYRHTPGTDTWVFEDILLPEVQATNMLFGTAVAIDQDRVVVNSETAQRTYVFEKGDNGWHQAAVLRDGTTPVDSFATDGVAALGNTIFTSDPYDDVSIADQGSVHITTVTQTAGDTPLGAEVIEPGTENIQRTGCTRSATNTPFQAANCGNGSTPSPDVWYSWTPTCDVNIIFDTYGSDYDTVISVHDRIPQAGNTGQIACNDDANFAAPNNHASLVTFNATGGTTYYVRVGGYNGQSGNYTLRSVASYASTPDTPAQAQQVSQLTTYFQTCSATSSVGLPIPCAGQAAKDIWFTYTAPASGMADINTCVSGFDTVLVVYTGTPQTGPQQVVACNDDGSCGGFPSLYSRVNVALTQGQSYLIRIGGFDPLDYGEGTLVLYPPLPCDSVDFNGDGLFPDTQDITDFLSVFSGGTCAAPNPPQCNADIDFNNDTLFPDVVDIDALLSVFGGGPCVR